MPLNCVQANILGKVTCCAVGSVLLASLLIGSCALNRLRPRWAPTAGQYVAFSLREAERLAGSGDRSSPQLAGLGGMTRLVGFVYDGEANDIILVGKVVEGRPGATLDDLVVALRARLVSATWPLVSIDPTAETQNSGILAVRFGGGIEGTQFGKQFLESDILLKRYSLGTLDHVSDSGTYRAISDRRTRNRLSKSGLVVRKVEWLSFRDLEQQISQYYGRSIQVHESLLCRFWFYPLPFSIAERDGVFVIRNFCMGVAKEAVYAGESDLEKAPGGGIGDMAADEFSHYLTENFSRIAGDHPILNQLETLHTMVAASEGIARLNDHPDLHYLLYDYPLKRVAVRKHYELEGLCGIFACSDHSNYLIRISGGIEMRTHLQRLNDGDVTAMREIVVKSRPEERSLCWKIPLTSWSIRNDEYCQELASAKDSTAFIRSGTEEKDLGFSLHAEAFQLAPSIGKDRGLGNVFQGFSSPPAPPPLKGVSMHIAVSYKSFRLDSSGVLDALRDSILELRPSLDSLSWPVPDTGGTKNEEEE